MQTKSANKNSMTVPINVLNTPGIDPGFNSIKDRHISFGIGEASKSDYEKDKALIETLAHSQMFNEFCNAFNLAFGLPLALRPVELWRLPLHNVRMENPFCALVAEKSSTCSICLQVQKSLAETAANSPKTVKCPFGMYDSAIPLKIGDKLIGYLQTGQVFSNKPDKYQVERVVKLLRKHGNDLESEKIRKAYLATPVLTNQQYEAVVTLLNIFSRQLVLLSNQLVVMQENAEPVIIKRAKEFIHANHTEDISLEDVAKYVNASVFYFCKMFKKYTGLNFTDYLSRLRIERAKNLLLNPNIKICDIAYEVGFQSLTHFNRVFRKITGLSPSEYRDKLPLG